MTKYLIYIGEGQAFDVQETASAIASIGGVVNPRKGKFIGSIFECEYHYENSISVVRISETKETVTIDGNRDESLDFALKLQSQMSLPLWITDMNFSFNLILSDFSSVNDLKRAISVQ